MELKMETTFQLFKVLKAESRKEQDMNGESKTGLYIGL